MENVTLKVEGMSCQHCVRSIEGSVSKLKGVASVNVDLESGTVAIQHEATVTLEQIKEEIEEQGFDVA